MEPQDRAQLEALKAQVDCPKQCACVYSSLDELCQGQYHADLDILECLEVGQTPPCPFARPFGCTLVCTCPLRKFIARNLDRWSESSTALLHSPAAEKED